MRDHRGNETVGAAFGKPHTALFFDSVDERVDRTGTHRVTADQQRMKRQSLAQLFVFHIRRNNRIDRTPRLIFHQGGRGLDHRREIEKRHRPELLIAFFIYALRIFEETAIALDIVRIELFDLRFQADGVVGIIEIGAVGPVEPVKRKHRHQFDIVGHLVPR